MVEVWGWWGLELVESRVGGALGVYGWWGFSGGRVQADGGSRGVKI